MDTDICPSCGARILRVDEIGRAPAVHDNPHHVPVVGVCEGCHKPFMLHDGVWELDEPNV
jgi:rRNA maturation endonuclease Nob1